MNSLQQTDSSAFEKLVDRYGKSLYPASFQILRNSQDAEDAVQETFLKAFQAIDGFRGDSSLCTWLYRIAQNQSLMKLRKRSRAVTVSLDAWTAASGGEQGSLPPARWLRCKNPDPGLSLHTRQLSEFIRDCIQELPDNYRQACLLKEGKSLSEEQVCRRLGISKPSMKSRVHRTRVRDHFSNQVSTEAIAWDRDGTAKERSQWASVRLVYYFLHPYTGTAPGPTSGIGGSWVSS